MIMRVVKQLVMVMTVFVLAFAFSTETANAATITAQGTDDTHTWVLDDGGRLYISSNDGKTDASDLTDEDVSYVLYSTGSMQVAYVSNASSADSISNTASMFEGSTGIAGADGSYYVGTYGNTAYTTIDAGGESGNYVIEDIAPAHAPGWAYEDGAYRFYEPDGTMRTNAWVSSGGEWYYLGADGAPVTNEWIVADGGYFYVGSDGKGVHDTRLEYEGDVYTFGADGTCTVTTTPSGSLDAVISACNNTPSTGSGGCAAWVTNVFTNAGIGTWHGNACDMYWSWCTSSDLSELKPGMIIAVSSCAGTAASRAYGHVGIYIGNGIVMQNLLGSVGTMTLDTWLSYFDGYSTPAWGWLGGVVLN